jgi:hypothetical protein
MFSFGGHFLGAATLIQSIVLYVALYCCVSYIFSSWDQRKKYILTSSLYVTPFFGSYGVTLWKDTLFASFTIIGFLLILNAKRVNSSKFVIGVITLTLGTLCRHEAWLTLIIISFLIVAINVFSSKKIELATLVALGITLGLVAASNILISNSKSIEKTPSWGNYATLLGEIEYVASKYPESVSGEDLKKLSLISTGASFDNAKKCESINGLVYSEGFNSSMADNFSKEIPRIWLHIARSGGAIHLGEARYCRINSLLPPPFGKAPQHGYWIDNGIVQPNSHNLVQHSPVPGLDFLLLFWSFIWQSNGSFVAWPGLHLLSILLCTGYLVKHGLLRKDYSVILLLVFSRTLTLLITAVAQDYRYQFLLNLISIPLLAFCIKNYFSNETLSPKELGS